MEAALTTLAIALGFVLDWIFGDPIGVWHPVCAIGSLISGTEKLLRRLFPATPRGEKIAGVFLWGIVCGISFAVPLALLFVLGRISPWLAFAAQTLFCYQIFARKCLVDAGEHVREALDKSLDDGRRAVAMYVGRDTGALTEEGVIKATVETIAENTTDGVIAPLFYMLLGGTPLAFLYKAVNTLDSMVGYHNEKYEHFGWCSAKLDDAFNFLPARIAAVCMVAGAGMLKFDSRNARRIFQRDRFQHKSPNSAQDAFNFLPARIAAVCMVAGAGMLKFDSRNARRIFQRDRFQHKSPNSAQTESVCAGALHIQLGGPAPYFGKIVQKPTIGDDDRAIVKSDIVRASDLMTTAAVFALLLGLAIRLAYFGKIVQKPTIGDDDRAIVKSDIVRASDLMTTAAVFALLLGLAIRLAVVVTPAAF